VISNHGNTRRKMVFREHNRQNFNKSFGPREMHKAICSDCGEECEVPFKPKEGQDVYCKECYQKHKKF